MEIIGYVLGQQQGSYSSIESVTVFEPVRLVRKKIGKPNFYLALFSNPMGKSLVLFLSNKWRLVITFLRI